MSTFRILSLDGGGIMGAFSASALATYEEICQKEHRKTLVEHFDLITGTSTGGIIAVGLAMGVSASKILDFYRTDGVKIFPRSGGVGGWVKKFRSLFRPKFPSDGLRSAISSVVGEKPLRDAQIPLVIPSYDASTGEIYLFKTPHHPDCAQNAGTMALDVALATSAAPTYFPAHTIPGGGTYIDGGVWGNCPAVVGIVEALSFFRKPLDEIQVLSISTTSNPFRITSKQQLGGLLGWSTKIIDTFMYSQAQAAIGQATCLLRDRTKREDRFHRIDYICDANVYKMDDTRAVEELIHIGRTRAEMVQNKNLVMNRFLNGESAIRASKV